MEVRPGVADLGADAGVETVANACATEPVTTLINNAGVAHYIPFVDLPADKRGNHRRRSSKQPPGHRG
jgi:short-subunit dehydrogenase